MAPIIENESRGLPGIHAQIRLKISFFKILATTMWCFILTNNHPAAIHHLPESKFLSFARAVADEYQLTREDMDGFAIRSLERSQQASRMAAWFPKQHCSGKTRKGETTVLNDEQPGNADIEKIPTLRPAFKEDGTVTAANSSSISDAASALGFLTHYKNKGS